MTKRGERLVVTSSFLTFAMVVALWLRMEANGRKGEESLLALKRELQGEAYLDPDESINLGDGLFPDSWRWSPGGLARNYPAESKSPVELPTWEEVPVQETLRSTSEGEGNTEEPVSAKPDQPINDKVSGIWYRGFALNKKAEEFASEGRFPEALKSYNEALLLMRSVRTEFPAFHPQIVNKRISLIVESRDQVESEMVSIKSSRLN